MNSPLLPGSPAPNTAFTPRSLEAASTNLCCKQDPGEKSKAIALSGGVGAADYPCSSSLATQE